VAPPANIYDFTFLAPCPSSGLIVQGDKDEMVPESSVQKLVNKLSQQRDITIDYRLVEGANHFFTNRLDQMTGHVADYLQRSVPELAESAETPVR
jgi:alpha/beta superfamily hydrolase